MIPNQSAADFILAMQLYDQRIEKILTPGLPANSYRLLVRQIALGIHDYLEEFGKSNAFEVYEQDYNHAFDALSQLNAFLSCKPGAREALEAAHACLCKVGKEGVPA